MSRLGGGRDPSSVAVAEKSEGFQLGVIVATRLLCVVDHCRSDVCFVLSYGLELGQTI